MRHRTASPAVRRRLIAVGIALVAGLLTSTGAAAATAPAGAPATATPQQDSRVHVLPPRPPKGSSLAFDGVSPMTSHGGPVLTSPKIYIDFWGAEWTTTSPSCSGPACHTNDDLRAYVTAMATSWGGTPWRGVDTQYCQNVASGTQYCSLAPGAEVIGNQSGQLGGVWIDTGIAVPAAPSQAQIRNEAARSIAHFYPSGPFDSDGVYFVYTPSGKSMTGFGSQFCAWHSAFKLSGTLAAYAYMPYIPDAGSNCGRNWINGTDNAFGNGVFDGVSVVTGHEMAEAESDPDVSSGWYDNVDFGAGENGDKCAWNQPAGGNVDFGTHHFAMQAVWSNVDNAGAAGGSCVLLAAVAPGPPIIGTATPGVASATVSWSPPASDGGSRLRQYTITGMPSGSVTAGPGATSAVVGGLSSGTSYTFTVHATNYAGGGPESAPSKPVFPGGAPGAPLNVWATATNGGAIVRWSAPASDGGSPITGYTVAGSPGGSATAGPGALSAVVTGLTNATPYTFTVSAASGLGTGPASAPSSPVVPGVAGPYTSVTPYRLLDTRGSLGGHLGRLGPNQTLTVQVSGTAGPGGGVPAGAAAAALNVTVTNPTDPSYLTLYPAGAGSRPQASNLNFGPGQTIANLTVVALSGSGGITVYNSQGTVDMLIDVQGWSAGASQTSAAGLFNALAGPTRLLDTRGQLGGHPGQLGPNSVLDLQVAGAAAGLPAGGISTVVLNVTAVNGSESSYLTLYPSGAGTRPEASNVNFAAGHNLPNRVIVKLGSGGGVSIYNSQGSVDVVVDASAWFTDATGGGTGALLYAQPPARILDTRAPSAVGPYTAPFGAGSSHAVPVAGRGGVPASGAVAVVANATATDTTAGSFLALYPSMTATPTASDLNFGPGESLPNLAVVRLGPDGAIAVYNDQGSVDVILDVAGYFA